jgi:hypothetical protein
MASIELPVLNAYRHTSLRPFKTNKGVVFVIDVILSVPGVTGNTRIACQFNLLHNWKKIELHFSKPEETRAPRPFSSEDDLPMYRHILNTKRDHLISSTQVNDKLITELLSSGVIRSSAEAYFTRSDVRLKSPIKTMHKKTVNFKVFL